MVFKEKEKCIFFGKGKKMTQINKKDIGFIGQVSQKLRIANLAQTTCGKTSD